MLYIFTPSHTHWTTALIANMAICKDLSARNHAMKNMPTKDFDFAWDIQFPQTFPD
jgi:hypothetical protein